MFKRVYSLLLPYERRKFFGVALSVLLSSLLEFAGLAALLPLVFRLLPGDTPKDSAIMLCGGVLLFVLIKCGLTTLLSFYQNRYLLNLYKRLSYTLYNNHFKRGLLLVRESGSVKLAQEINYNCFAFGQNLLSPMLRIIADLILALLVTVVMVIYEPLIVGLLYVAFIPFVLFYFLCIKRAVKRIGKQELRAMQEQSKVVLESFKGYSEIEVNGGYGIMEERFIRGASTIVNSRLKLLTIMRLPAILSEVAIVIGLGILIYLKSDSAIEIFSVFAVAAFRLLPALRNVVMGWTQVNSAIPCLEIIEKGVEVQEGSEIEASPKIEFENSISINNLVFKYPDGERVIDGLNYKILKGDYIGIRGVSGSGKSTLFNLLLGLLEPAAGSVLIDENRLVRGNRDSWLRRVGYVAQDIFMVDGTLLENVALGAGGQVVRERIVEALKRADLGEWMESLPQGIDTPMHECGAIVSGGQKQRIGIARALYKGADVLLLDEATSALDNMAEERINATIATLRKEIKGLTILSIAHRDSSLSYCDKVLELDKIK